MESNRVVVRLKSMISFAGVKVEVYKTEQDTIHVLKPSDVSNVLLHIPQNEIDTIFDMNGVRTKGD